MSAQSPDSPGLSRGSTVVLAVVCLAILTYSVVIAGQILLGLLVCAFVLGVPLAYRLLRAVFRFVHATERIADALEQIAASDGSSGRLREGASRRRSTSTDHARNDDSGGGGSRDHVDDRW